MKAITKPKTIGVRHNSVERERPIVLEYVTDEAIHVVELTHEQLAKVAIESATLELTLRGISKPVQKERKRWFGRQ